MINQINELENYFENMEREGKVDSYLEKTLSIIEYLKKKLNTLNKELLLKKNPPKQLFELYHLIKVNILIFNSMYERLKVAKDKKDNPVIAMNSLNVIPLIKQGAHNISNLKMDEFNLDLALSLQMTASQNNLFNLKSSKTNKNLNKTFSGIVEGMDLTI